MGEHAIRNSDGTPVKMGTCGNMYYMRYEDRGKVTPQRGSSYGLRWRIPYPDEDDVLPGDYTPAKRTVGLMWNYEPGGELKELMLANYGTMQFCKHGLLLNVHCYHGLALPQGSDEIKVHWNGRRPLFELASLRAYKGRLYPVVACAACEHAWREDWHNVLPHVRDKKLRNRLAQYIGRPVE